MAPIFARANQNAVFVQAGSDGVVVGPTIFRLTPVMATYYPLALKYLQSKGVKSLADIYLNDNPTYTGIDKLLSDSASKYGYSYAGNVGVATTQTDVSAAVSKLIGMNTDAVSVLMNGAPAASVVGQLRQHGYKGTIIAAPNIGANNVLAAVGDAGNGVVWSTDWASTSTVKASQDFVDAYQKKYGKAPDVYAAEAFDSAFFIANAIKKAGSADQAAVAKAMTQLGQDGFSGVLGGGLKLQDGSEVAPGQLVQWQNGQIVAVPGS
jgi:branched-chain amino acid transport system substrate-binding protein